MFRRLREKDEITEQEVIESLDPHLNRDQIFQSNLKTKKGETTNKGGKSGSFFFFTHDSKFLVKTMRNSEVKAYL